MFGLTQKRSEATEKSISNSRNYSPFLRSLRTEPLEMRLLLAIDTSVLAEIQTAYAGFDYTDIVAEKVTDLTNVTAQSLQNAIANAKIATGNDMIVIRTTETANTITISSQFDISDSNKLIIIAWGTDSLTIDAKGNSRIFNVQASSTLSLGNLTLTGGSADNGGAICNAGTLVGDRLRISGNTASKEGGGIYSTNMLNIYNTLISGNIAQTNGGGLCSTGTYVEGKDEFVIIVHNCTITGNTAGKGGGIYFYGGDLKNIDQTTASPLCHYFSYMVMCNTIVVNNRSNDSVTDANIYKVGNDNDQNDRLLLGVNCLTTRWTNYFSEEANIVYDPGIPLFVRDYDFTTETEGDYRLVNSTSSSSQAVDAGNNSYVVYEKNINIKYDIVGSSRICNATVDIGAYELELYATLKTQNGGTLTTTTLPQGAQIEVKGITVQNTSSVKSQTFYIHFYASTDTTISAEDTLLGYYREVAFLGAKSSQKYDSGLKGTSDLIAGTQYYLGWIIQSPSGDTILQSTGRCSTPFTVLPETSVEAIELEKTAYSVQLGSDFYLAVKNPDEVTSCQTCWWNYGNGTFVKGDATGLVGLGQYPAAGIGTVTMELKVVDNATNAVVKTCSAELTISDTIPLISVSTQSFLNGRCMQLAIDVQTFGRTIKKWAINWNGTSDKVEEYESVSSVLTAVHYFSMTGKNYPISLKLTYFDDSESDTFSIANHLVPSGSSSALLPDAELMDEAFSADNSPLAVDWAAAVPVTRQKSVLGDLNNESARSGGSVSNKVRDTALQNGQMDDEQEKEKSVFDLLLDLSKMHSSKRNETALNSALTDWEEL